MSSNDDKHPGDDWLYDRSGAPDADVERLEKLLRPLGTRDDAVVPAMTTSPRRRVPLRVKLIVGIFGAAAAAVLVAVQVHDARQLRQLQARRDALIAQLEAMRPEAGLTARSQGYQRRPPAAPVDVELDTAGKPLTWDGWVETTDVPRELTIGDDLGRVTLRAGSRVQVRQANSDVTRLYLERGSLEAFVSADARPRFFQVDTDAARCVDLGCRYTLDVAAADGPAGSGVRAGDATVRVTTGQVAFETDTREVFIPAGAVCVARKGSGPGTPRFEDAGDAVKSAFDAYDAAPIASAASPKARAAQAALDAVKYPRDTLPAWHLLQDHDPAVAAAAAARLEAVAGKPQIPDGATPADVRAAWKEHLAAKCW